MSTVEGDLLDRIRGRIAAQGAEPSPALVADALRKEGRLVGDAAVLHVFDALRDDTLGAGPLDPLLRLDGVTDVLVNGPTQVFVDTGLGLQRSGVCFPDDAAVRRLAQRLAASAGRRLDDASPYVDVRLRDGTRFHAVLAPLSKPGTCLSLRVPARRTMTLEDLVSAGSITRAGGALLLEVVRARLAFLVSGGTGSGKTTLLAALLSYVPAEDRIVIVEDASELRPRHPHVVSMEARQANVEGAGAVPLRELVRQALRMRPDRLVVGEVRGAEVVDLLAALNTGHEGGCGTLHANTAADVPARLEALGVAAGLPRDAVHAQLASALHAVLHVRRHPDGVRRLDEVGVVCRDERGYVRVSTAVSCPADREPVRGPAADELEGLLTSRSGR